VKSTAIEASTRLAQTALHVKEREIARNLKDYAFWDAAFENLHAKVNLEWAATDGNVAGNIYNSLGYDMAYVLSPERKTIYSLRAGVPTIADALMDIPKLAALLPEAAKGGPAKVGLIKTSTGTVMAAAAAILPSDETQAPSVNERSFLVFVKKIDETFLATLSLLPRPTLLLS
jgi:sensor domain CHASE-containing protein